MRKLLLAIVAVLCFYGTASAQYVKVLGIAGRSTKVVTSGTSSTNSAYVTYPLATIDIYNAGTTTHAAVFSNSTGTVKANPFSAGSTDAVYDFFVASGVVFDVRISGVSGGVTITPFTRAGYTAPGTNGISLALCGGTADTALLAALNTLGGTIQIPNTITCASNTQTISAALQINNGGLLKPVTGQTITLTGGVNPDTWQHFTNATAGLGTAAFTANKSIPAFSPYWWGTNTAAFQAAVTAAVSVGGGFGGTVKWQGEYQTTAYITVTGPVTIDGGGMGTSSILCLANSGFLISNGVNFVTFKGFQLAQAVRDSSVTNAYTGITFQGTTAVQSYRILIRDLYIDGFHVGILADGVSGSTFDHIETNFGKYGFQAGQQTLNNFLGGGSHFTGFGAAGSVGVMIGDGNIDAEGWHIDHITTANFARGVVFSAVAFSYVTNSVIDFNSEFGVLLTSATGPVVGNHIIDNYIGMTGTADTGIYEHNNAAIGARQNTGSFFINNTIFPYVGSSVTNGILIDGSVESNHKLDGNSAWATTHDCRINTGTNLIVGLNHWNNTGYLASVLVTYQGNVGTLVPSAATTVLPLAIPRYFVNGSDLTTGNVVLSAGWGTTPVVTVTAKDQAARITIVCDNTAGASPTVTVTFADGTWTATPIIVPVRGDAAAPTTAYWRLKTPSVTAPVFEFVGTPVAGNTYIMDFIVMGRQ
jgi:hypothetical protein